MNKNKKITIFDIAKACNVSYATVSRAINGQSDINENTRAKILEKCNELGYKPNAMARGLSQKKSWLVGVVFENSFDNPFFGKILTNLRLTLEEKGYELIFFDDMKYKKIDQLFERIKYRSLDALVVVGVNQNTELIRKLEIIDIPLVTINFRLKNHSAVISHQYRGSWKALEKIWEMGHRDIAFVSSNLESTSGRYRYYAYRRFMKSKNVDIKENDILYSNFSMDARNQCYKLVSENIKKGKVPSAYFCAYDMMAIGVIEALLDNGIRVPEDVSVVGFDDLNYCTFIRPTLTTVKQNREQLGKLAGEEVIRLLEEKDAKSKTIDVPTSLVMRNSLAEKVKK